MKMHLIASAVLLAGLGSAATSAADISPYIDGLQVTANGTMYVSIGYAMIDHPMCADSSWDYVVPADAPAGLRNAVVDAVMNNQYLNDFEGTGACTGQIEVLKSITTSIVY